MPWTCDKPPAVAKNWTAEETEKCVTAANAALADGGDDESAIFACIRAAGKSKEGKAMTEGKAGVDLDAFRSKVRESFEAQFPQDTREKVWVSTVFDDGLVAHMPDGNYQYFSYVVSKETGQFSFSGGTPVRRVDTWEAVDTAAESNAVIAIPNIAAKAGKRLAGNKIEQLHDLMRQLNGAQSLLSQILGWAQYSDNSPLAVSMLSGDWLLNELEAKFGGVDEFISLLSERTGPPRCLREVKSTDKGMVYGGYMAVWGSPKNRDIQLDYFTPETRFWLDFYKSAPAIFHHGQDPKIGRVPLGHRDDAKKDGDGLWVQDWISKSDRYFGIVRALIDAGKLYYSPGSVPQLVERTADREVKSYPIVEDTGTPTPAQFSLGLEDRPLGLVKMAYKTAGFEFNVPDELRGKVPDEAGPLTSEGGNEFDEAAARLRLTKSRLLTLSGG